MLSWLHVPGRGLGRASARLPLAIYDVAHSLPLGGVDGEFLFTEDETRRHVEPLWYF